MKSFLVLMALSLASLPAVALEPRDQGVFALVNSKGTVTTKIARLSLGQGQWQLEDRLPDGTWQDVTCSVDCTLQVSTPQAVEGFTRDTPLAGLSLACVHNIAFAFCSDAAERYHMLAFVEGQVIPLEWVRLDPDTLQPAR